MLLALVMLPYFFYAQAVLKAIDRDEDWKISTII